MFGTGTRNSSTEVETFQEAVPETFTRLLLFFAASGDSFRENYNQPSEPDMRAILLVALITTPLAAQSTDHADHSKHHPDTAFAALQERGKSAMGVDQYSSTHRFEPLAGGGRIELQRDSTDNTDIEQIRQHLREIAGAFQQGNFDTPMMVHAQDVPGTAVMKAKRDRIRYEFRPLPRGGEVRITSTDSTAVEAVHQFLAFQRKDHRATQ